MDFKEYIIHVLYKLKLKLKLLMKLRSVSILLENEKVTKGKPVENNWLFSHMVQVCGFFVHLWWRLLGWKMSEVSNRPQNYEPYKSHKIFEEKRHNI